MVKEVLQKTAIDYTYRGKLDPESFMKNVTFETYDPPGDLAFLIEHFWVIHIDHNLRYYQSDQLMHRPYVDVFISVHGSGVQGTFRTMRQYEAWQNSRIVGVRFRPGAFHTVYNGTMSELCDQLIDLDLVFPAFKAQHIKELLTLEDQDIFDQIIHQLRKMQPKRDQNIELVNAIISTVEADDKILTVAEVAAVFGKSERWLQQLFRDYVGVGIKWFLQMKRILLVAKRIRDGAVDWADLAYDAGYSSQQHFNNDFKRVIGKSPCQYKKEML